MGCLKTDNCCCCFSLRTGGLIIGWFGVISSTMGIVANQSESIDYIRFINKYHLEPRVDLIRNIVALLVCVLLLYGIYNKRSSFLLPQVVLSVIGFIAVLISIGLAIVAAILAMNSNNQKEKERGTALLAALLFLLPLLGLIWHFTSVIYSLYQKLKEDNDQHTGVAYHVGAQRDPYKV